jgi:hypothetical protein
MIGTIQIAVVPITSSIRRVLFITGCVYPVLDTASTQQLVLRGGLIPLSYMEANHPNSSASD